VYLLRLVIKSFYATDSIKRQFVNVHNSVRRITRPPAANMRILSWDDELQGLATNYSKACLFAHNKVRMMFLCQTKNKNEKSV